MKKDSELNKLQQLNDLSHEINQLWAEYLQQREIYHILLEEFYKNTDNLSDRPLHLRIMKK
jgi:hypothetical protein